MADQAVASGREVSKEVFLSPRVLDSAAFESFAGTLRELIERASQQGRALESASASAEATRSALGELGGAYKVNLEEAAALFDRLREHEARAGELLAKVEGWSSRIERADAELSRLLRDTMAQAEQRAQEHADRLSAHAEAVAADLERRAAEAVARLEAVGGQADKKLDQVHRDVRTMLTPTLRALTGTCNRAAALLGRDPTVPEEADEPTVGSLGDIVQRAEGAKQKASEAADQLHAVKRQAEMARQMLKDAVVTSGEQVDQALNKRDELERSLQEMLRLCEEAERSLGDRSADVERVLGESVGRLDERAVEAETRIGRLIEDAEASRQAAERGAAVQRELAAELRELAARLEPWRGLAAEGDTLPEPARRVVDAMRREVRRDVSAIAESLREIAGRVEGALEA
jgi:chromosome segregation ATPase